MVIFEGYYNETLGEGDNLYGKGALLADITVYGPDGKIDDSLIGYTMTSNASKYTPIDNGIYEATKRDWKGSGLIPKYYQLFENGKDNIRTLNGVINNNAPEQVRKNGDGYKTEIFIHSTLRKNNRVGTKTSTGCLLLEWDSMIKFDKILSSLGSGVKFCVIVNRNN